MATPAARLAPFTDETFRHARPSGGRRRLVGRLRIRAMGRQAAPFATRMGKGGARNRWTYLALGERLESHDKSNGGGEKWEERDGHRYSAPANSFKEGASLYGCVNMAGNVAEWTQEGMLMGGGSNSNPSQVRCCASDLREPDYRSFQIGFRCATSSAAVSSAAVPSPVSGDSE